MKQRKDVTRKNEVGQVINLSQSLRLQREVGARNRRCWENSIHALAVLQREDPKARYVEGHAVSKFGLVFQHGWLESRGQIIEPTPTWRSRGSGVPVYFPGKRYSFAGVQRQIARRPDGTLPFIHGGYAFSRDPAYQASCVAATAHAFRMTPEQAMDWLTGKGLSKPIDALDSAQPGG